MDSETRGLLEAIRDAMALAPSQKREDATCAVYAVLHVLLDDDPPSVASQARWLREELAAIEDGGGNAALARRTITGLIRWEGIGAHGEPIKVIDDGRLPSASSIPNRQETP